LPGAFWIYKLNSAQVGDLGGAMIIAVDVTLGDIPEIDKAKAVPRLLGCSGRPLIVILFAERDT